MRFNQIVLQINLHAYLVLLIFKYDTLRATISRRKSEVVPDFNGILQFKTCKKSDTDYKQRIL